MTRYYFSDESGDPGLSGATTSSRYFILTLVALPERASLPELAAVRRALHFTPSFEFRFHNTKPHHRALFFQTIHPIPFRVRAAVIDKAKLDTTFHRMTGRNLIVEWLVRLILRAPASELAEDVLIMDGAVPQLLHSLRARLSSECRQLQRPRPFKRLVSGDSSRDDGLQLADMIAGAFRQLAVEGESDCVETFANKISAVWNVPSDG